MANNSTNATATFSRSSSLLTTNILIFLSALNIFLCITATLGNVLVLIALHKVSSICPPTKLMFRFLAVTDLCVGLISHPLSAVFLLNSPRLNNIFFISFFVSSLILPVPSVLTSAAIAVDRLLALMLRLRYRHVVTLRRVRAVILCFCSISVLCGALFITSIFAFSTRNMRYLVFNVIFNGSIILALVTSTYSYTKIFFTLHRHQAQLQGHLNPEQPNEGGNPLNIARYKKTVYTVAWIQLVLLVCYSPFIVMTIRLFNNYGSSEANAKAFFFVTCLVNLNSTLNPILYCWRIRDVRQQVKNILRKCVPC